MTTGTTRLKTVLETIKRKFSTRIGRGVLAITLVVGMTGILFALFEVLDLQSYFDEFLDGVSTTLTLYAFALFFGFLVGLFFAIIRVYGGPILSRIATGYIEVIRGTPVVTQIIILAYLPDTINVFLNAQGIPPIPLSWGLRYLMCAICLGMNSSAYQAEFFRGSITSISAGQMMAARAIGMSRVQGIRQIILPQSMRRVIPAWANEASYLPKVTTAAYIVGVTEVFHWAYATVSRTFKTLEVYALVAFFFIILISFITWFLDTVYDEIKIPGL
jgi:polar amino acid transport system permease protein